MNILQQLVRAYLREELDRILNPVCQRVLVQVLKGERRGGQRTSTGETRATHLVVGADGSDVNDGIGIVKERRPCVPLPTRPADVVKPPLYRTVAMLYREGVLGNADGLDPGVENIIDGRHITLFGNPIDLIKETVR